jgi:hypothetical protein
LAQPAEAVEQLQKAFFDQVERTARSSGRADKIGAGADEKVAMDAIKRSVFFEEPGKGVEPAIPGRAADANATPAAETVGRQVSMAAKPLRENRNPFVQVSLSCPCANDANGFLKWLIGIARRRFFVWLKLTR